MRSHRSAGRILFGMVARAVVEAGSLLGLVAMLACGADDGDSGEPSMASTGAEASTSSTQATAGLDSSSGEGSGETGALPCGPAAGVMVQEDVALEASDGTTLAATVARPTEGGCLPGVLLVHQYTLDRSQWEAMIPALVDDGYVVLALDLRGHGDSDPQSGALSELLTDPEQAPLDVAAGLEWLAAEPHVDAERVGVVGTSIGANLSVVALHQGRASVAVPISPRLDPILSLAGGPGSLSLGPVFCVATENDGGGDQASTCVDLVDGAGPNSALQIITESAAHGVDLLAQFPEVEPTIRGWLGTTL